MRIKKFDTYLKIYQSLMYIIFNNIYSYISPLHLSNALKEDGRLFILFLRLSFMT